VWEEFECTLNEGKEHVDLLWVGDDGARARERCCQGGKGSRLVGQMGCESIMCSLESSEGLAILVQRLLGSQAYLVAPFSIAIWLPRSLSCSVTLLTIWSDALPFSSMPLRARLSTAAILDSMPGEMPSLSKSESDP
jgi:hypothetical protein